MKTLITTAAVVLSVLAVPAFADSNAIARAHFAQDETGIEARVFLDGTTSHSARAAAVLNALILKETGNERRALVEAGDPTSLSSRDAHNIVARDIFEALKAEQPGNG